MQESDERLIVSLNSKLKRKFMAAAKLQGQTASFIVRGLLTEYTKKGETNGSSKRRTKRPAAKTLS